MENSVCFQNSGQEGLSSIPHPRGASLRLKPSLGILALLLMGLASGCGNDLSDARPVTQLSSSSSPAVYSGAQLQSSAGYACPSDQTAQIRPQFDRRLDRSGYYTVCTHDQLHSKVELLGEPSDTTAEICVFPAQERSSTDIRPKLDPYRQGLAYSHCAPIAAGPRAQIEFLSLEYNAVFIVPKAERDSMARCLARALWEQCPDFSYGKFRELAPIPEN